MLGKIMQLVCGPLMYASCQLYSEHEFCNLYHHFCIAWWLSQYKNDTVNQRKQCYFESAALHKWRVNIQSEDFGNRTGGSDSTQNGRKCFSSYSYKCRGMLWNRRGNLTSLTSDKSNTRLSVLRMLTVASSFMAVNESPPLTTTREGM